MSIRRIVGCVAISLAAWMASAAAAGERMIEGRMHHLRAGGEVRQWSDFPEQADGERLVVTFEAEANETEYTLWLRQYQVRHLWELTLNGERLRRLPRDERDMTIAWPVPAGTLVKGENTLVIESTRAPYSDDLLVGEIRLDPRPRQAVLNAAQYSHTLTETQTNVNEVKTEVWLQIPRS